MDKTMKIDPEKFAYNVMNSTSLEVSDDVEANAKKKLLQYLSAYYLAIDFNSLEISAMEDAQAGLAYPSYQKVLETINATTWGR